MSIKIYNTTGGVATENDAGIIGNLLFNVNGNGYNYRQTFTVNHTDDGAQTNYQMKVLVGESSGATGEDVDCGGHCLSTFNDLRFQGYSDIDQDTIVDLDYWIESITGTTPNQLATVWIEVAYIPAHPDNTTVWMYYGRTGATAGSNGANTFTFFDHFDSDMSQWTGDTDNCSIASSIVSINQEVGTQTTVFSDTKVPAATCRLRTRVKRNPAATNYSAVFIGTALPDHSKYTREYQYYTGSYVSAGQNCNGGAVTAWNPSFTRNAFNIVECLVRGGTNTRWFEDGVEGAGSPYTGNPPNSADMYAFLVCYSTGSTAVQIECDWIFLAKYTYAEPTWGAWGSEELPVTFTAQTNNINILA